MDGKVDLSVVAVCLIGGMLIGGFCAYVVLHESEGQSNFHVAKGTQFYYYIDYGQYETNSIHSGWISAVANNAVQGLFRALQQNGIPHDIVLTGFNTATIKSVNNINPSLDSTATVAYNWSLFVWTYSFNSYSSAGWQNIDTVSGVMLCGDTFYLGVTPWDNSNSTEHVCLLDPNTTTGWSDGGPFSVYTQ